MQPVLEMNTPDGFGLWPVAETERFSFLPLSGELSPAEIGTALMRIAACNDVDPADFGGLPPRPAEPLSGFLHGLLNLDNLYAAGGLCVTDNSTGITFSPGCCDGLEDWHDWHHVADGSGMIGYGHDPQSSLAERLGDTVRLTVDTDRNGPVFELSATQLRRLLAGAERDLTEFLAAATDWISEHLPDHSTRLTAALARLLALPAPGTPPTPPGTAGRDYRHAHGLDARRTWLGQLHS
ncbi:hypothetical protein OOK31_36995 [Streptomyces sp. NBC_00249]|uniref:hypothetical protein n=1 Tax=Streptomyces sp. NBC_00249 TaxID=2975690 RepID=UPI00224CBF6E|nr:hypothetical protein [Streptomyces sp. NBC_00249]MCX5199411.1 hypothetical protein [Streptomyces sp. NBC_00249]